MKNNDKDSALNMTRRGFIKASSALGGVAAVASGITLPFKSKPAAAAVTEVADEKVVWSACTVNCGSRCPLRMHVQNGEIKYVETDNTGDDVYGKEHQVRACCVVARCAAVFTIQTA
ncbi:anaerobic dimethyl sulfoxide reductase chain A [Vibrio sp. JCM 19236]|nr:anaerobic dimethyl sulfoxide reductase chain A [Vibrio sp. JCM 19236]